MRGSPPLPAETAARMVALTRRSLRRGVFKSVHDLHCAINRYIDEHNDDPKPFIWTKSAEKILDKLNKLSQPSESVH